MDDIEIGGALDYVNEYVDMMQQSDDPDSNSNSNTRDATQADFDQF
ncbi:hypothetical protein OYT88_06320 [Sporolactobacillus sp. CQH2019]|nr:hypothetical protein [Sporolactobacillus sp. CQH2019]MDD9148161.1 hypothetical protein [Sporolactobacillus sp. CQH2019]